MKTVEGWEVSMAHVCVDCGALVRECRPVVFKSRERKYQTVGVV